MAASLLTYFLSIAVSAEPVKGAVGKLPAGPNARSDRFPQLEGRRGDLVSGDMFVVGIFPVVGKASPITVFSARGTSTL